MKNIKITAISLALLFSFFHLDSSTSDKTAQQAGEVSAINLEQALNDVATYLKNDKYQDALDYVLKLKLDQEALIQFLTDLMSESTEVIFAIHRRPPYALFIDILIHSPELHYDEAIRALKKELIMTVKGLVPKERRPIDSEKDRDAREQLLEVLIDTLIAAGVNFKNTFGATLLTNAIDLVNPSRLYQARMHGFRNNDKFAQFLINTGKFDPNIVDDRGQSPLVAAIHSQSLPLVDDLITHGAKANKKDLSLAAGTGMRFHLDPIWHTIADAIENEATGQASSAASSSSVG